MKLPNQSYPGIWSTLYLMRPTLISLESCGKHVVIECERI